MAPSDIRRSSRRATTQAVSYTEPALTDASSDSGSPPPATPAKTRGTKRPRAIVEEDEYALSELHGTGKHDQDASDSPLSDLDDSDADASSPKKKKKSPKKTPKKKARHTAAGSTGDEDADMDVDGETASVASASSPTKKKRPTKPKVLKPDPVFDIPDLPESEKKTTTFKGRLGYACLNTVLRNRKPADFAIFCSRTCRIDTIKEKGLEFVKELGRQNVKDLLALIEWNEKNNIRFMRMSSEMFPFASHPEYGYTLEYAAEDLAAVGALANKYGHRLTTHPGQFTQLGSPRPEVVRNAVRDLKYHCEMIDRMGLGKDSVMIIHGGGVFGDKPVTLARMKENYINLLPDNVKGRLVLENDEMCYSAEDLLPMCEELDIPLVFDYHHDWILPSSIGREEVIRRANAIFAKKGIKPKQHLSEPRPGAVTVMERRAHSDRCQTLPDELPDDMDLMIEAKDKEQAVLHLHRLYDLQPVVQASLRPPADVESLHTNGRKSTKSAAKARAKAKAEAEDEEADGDEGEGKAGSKSPSKSPAKKTAKSPAKSKATPAKSATPKEKSIVKKAPAKKTPRKKAVKTGIVDEEDAVKGEDVPVVEDGEGVEDPEADATRVKAEEHAYEDADQDEDTLPAPPPAKKAKTKAVAKVATKEPVKRKRSTKKAGAVGV